MTITNDKPAWALHFPQGDVPFSFDYEAKPIHSYLDYAAENYPKRKAILFENLTLTYKQLRDKAEIMANALREHGLQSGERVAIMLPNIPQTIIAVWAVLKAGGVLVMTNPLYMERELTHHFNDSRVKFLITLDLFWEKIQKLEDKLSISKYFITGIADGLAFPLNYLYPLKAKKTGTYRKIKYSDTVIPYKKLFSSSKKYNEYPVEPENTLAMLQYTGGTTGLSKAAMLSHGNISIHLQQLEQVIQEDGEVEKLSIAVMPFFHIFGLMGTVFLPAFLASPTLPIPRYVPGDILRLIEKYRPRLFIGAPSVYIGLMQQKDIKKYDLTCIDLCIVGASSFPVDALRKFNEITQANITEGFGLTECSPCVAANPVYGMKKYGSVGVPFPGTYIRIVDLETGTQEMGVDELGEVIIKGPQVMSGYWERDEENALAIRDGWFFTGDIAYKDEDGYIFIVDRKKDMAIIGGYNVYPREIEEVLYEHPKVLDAVSISVPDKTRGEKIKAYIVVKPGEKIATTELVAFCKEKLANYKVPKIFEFREELPKSLVGKVLRRVLRDEEIEKQNGKKKAPVTTENKEPVNTELEQESQKTEENK